MLYSFTLAFLTCAATVVAAPTANTSQPFSLWMANSFQSKGQPANNHYVPAVLHEGYQKAATLHKDAALLNKTSKAVSSTIAENGTIIGWNPNKFSLDDIRIGNNYLYFWDAEGRKEKKYEIAAASLMDQLYRFPRNEAGGFWHRDPTYPNQMWLDGIYMADVFYATYTHFFDPTNTTAWADIALQFDLIEEHTRNHTSNLLAHGYDESKVAVWADPVTGASPHVWDRALGWYFMALVELLQVYPKDLPAYSRLQGYLTTLADGVKKAQDVTGGWWLIMDEPYPGMEGNYIESSATAMFTYSYLKGVRTGLLDAAYVDTAVKAYDLMLEDFVKKEANGTLSWEGTVQVGSLSGNASYEYYIGVKVDENDGKGAAPFMFASTEIEMLKCQ